MDEPLAADRSAPVLDTGVRRRLTERSDRKGLARLVAHLGLLVVTSVAIARTQSSWAVLPAVVAHGVVLSFLFAPLHESIHRTAFRRRWLNDAVAYPIGLLLVLPPSYFRYFHFAHHRHTQDPDRDPELARPRPATRREWLVHLTGLPYWWAAVSGLVRHASGRPPALELSDRAARTIGREARGYLLVYVAIAAASIAWASPAVLWWWVLPALAGQPFLRLYLLAEHAGCPLVPDMLRNSRTTRSNAAVRFLAWNMPFHAEHHAFPSVPFHALPDVHTLVADRLGTTATGYLAVHRQLWRDYR